MTLWKPVYDSPEAPLEQLLNDIYNKELWEDVVRLFEFELTHYLRRTVCHYPGITPEDLANDAFSLFYEALQQGTFQLKDKQSTAAWLKKTARHHARKLNQSSGHRGKHKRVQVVTSAFEKVAKEQTSVLGRCAKEEKRVALLDCIQRLDCEQSRTILNLYVFEEMTFAQISEDLSIPKTTVMRTYKTAQVLLGQQLAKEGFSQ